MQGQPTPPQWLSTHPSPTNRIKNIDEKKNEHQCKGKESNSSVYQNIKALIAKITPPPPKTTSGANTNNAPALPKTNTPTPDKSNEKPAPAGTGPMAPKKVLKKDNPSNACKSLFGKIRSYSGQGKFLYISPGFFYSL